MQRTDKIQGAIFEDDRGEIKFFNTMDMGAIVRFYEIVPSSPDIIRAWQGHRQERKWFYCHTGSFVIHVAPLLEDGTPNTGLEVKRFVLSAGEPLILEIAGGNANGFRALEPGSKLMVFSNFGLEASAKDDLRFPLETWEADWQ